METFLLVYTARFTLASGSQAVQAAKHQPESNSAHSHCSAELDM